LSDSELINILTRTTLTQLRSQDSDTLIPLYCVEYDNPDTKTTQSDRWSALTNIHILKQMITRIIFGPPKYILDLNISMGAREPEAERDAFMRTQLRVDTLFPPVLEGEESFARDKLGNKFFPESAVSTISAAYRDTWSTALLTLLSEILPFKAHADALIRLKQDWLPDEAIATLANDALFSGVGMYWTLHDSATFYQEERAGRPRTPASRPDVVKAWDLIVSKQTDFEELRAQELLGNKSRKEAANQLYQAVNTHACQLGLALTLGTINELAAKDDVGVVELAHAMANAINSWMDSKTSGDYDRRIALAKRRDRFPKNPLNVIANMDAPRAMQFRYFWLEILSSPQAEGHIEAVTTVIELRNLRDRARASYTDYIATEKAKALRTTNPEMTEPDRRERAQEETFKELRIALNRWFEIPVADIDAWRAAGSASTPNTEALETVDSTDMEREEETSDTDTVNVNDLIDPEANLASIHRCNSGVGIELIG
jgi:hypothetical protein